MSKKDDVAISVKGVYKDFRLPHEGSNSIKTKIVRAFDKKRSGEDIQHVLRGVSFDVKRGEFFGIVGRNGSGKSTLLKIIAEIYKPTEGTVSVNGLLVPFIELGVGFNPELTGRENVFLNGALLGFTRDAIKEMYDDIVKFAEIEEFMDQKLKNYSSGMQVRLAFSVAIRANADILVLDEVLAVGDADFQRKCFNYFKELKNDKKTVILVTHDMSAVKEYCSRAILLQDGKIVHSGNPETVADEYLKQFNRVSNDTTQEEISHWGNGDVVLIDHDIVIDRNVKIELTFKATADVKDVVVGFRLYNSTGDVITGASTVNARKGATDTIAFKKNEIKRFVFKGDNILGTGDYRLGYTVRLADKVTICDNNDNLSSIQYNSPESYQPIVWPVTFSAESVDYVKE